MNYAYNPPPDMSESQPIGAGRVIVPERDKHRCELCGELYHRVLKVTFDADHKRIKVCSRCRHDLLARAKRQTEELFRGQHQPTQ